MEPQVFQRMLDQLRTDLRADVQEQLDVRFAESSRSLQEQLDVRFAESSRSLQEQLDVRFSESNRSLQEGLAENRRHFNVVAEDLRSDLRLVAEGVGANTERIVDLRSEMQKELTEVKSMIRLSHSELDRRLRWLEDSLIALQSRVDRLEASAS